MSKETRLATINHVAAQIDIPLVDYMELCLLVEEDKHIVLPYSDHLDLRGCDLTNMKILGDASIVDAKLTGTTASGSDIWKMKLSRDPAGPRWHVDAVYCNGKRVDPLPHAMLKPLGISEHRDSMMPDVPLITSRPLVLMLDEFARGRKKFTNALLIDQEVSEKRFGDPPVWFEGDPDVVHVGVPNIRVYYTARHTPSGGWWALAHGEPERTGPASARRYDLDVEWPNYPDKKAALRAASLEVRSWLREEYDIHFAK